MKDDRIDPNVYYGIAASPLYTAICKKNNFAFNKLLRHEYLQINAFCKDKRYRALHMCIFDNHFDFFAMLLTKPNIDMNAGLDAENYKSPLFIACEKDKPMFIKELLKYKELRVDKYTEPY